MGNLAPPLKSDAFSVGAILYQLLLNGERKLFNGNNREVMISLNKECDIDKCIGSTLDSINPYARDLLLDLLTKDPSLRPNA